MLSIRQSVKSECFQEKWANFHGSWGKRYSTDPDYEELEAAAMEQMLPEEQVSITYVPTRLSISQLDSILSR